MEFQDRAEPRRSLSRPVLSTVLGALVAVAVFVLVVLTSIVLYRVTSTPQTEQLSLRERFPGHFRTPEEQRRVEQELFRSQATPTSDWVDGGEVTDRCNTENCSLGFASASGIIPITPAEVVTPNACCISRSYHDSPKYMVDIFGIERHIASFGIYRQYFYHENCSQVSGCMYCTCSSTNYVATAVYVNGSDQYDVSFFKFKGCCKCIN